MSGKKKVILFLGAVSLIAFGNYKQFTKNKAQTTVEGKTSEKATSSANGTAKEGKVSEKATSSAGAKKELKAKTVNRQLHQLEAIKNLKIMEIPQKQNLLNSHKINLPIKMNKTEMKKNPRITKTQIHNSSLKIVVI